MRGDWYIAYSPLDGRRWANGRRQKFVPTILAERPVVFSGAARDLKFGRFFWLTVGNV